MWQVGGRVGEPGNFSTVALSRDGKQGAEIRQDSQSASRANLWLYDFTRSGASTRFTFDNSADAYPIFSPDGSRIVFTSNRDRPRNLYQKLTSLNFHDTIPPEIWTPSGVQLYAAVEVSLLWTR